MTESGIWLEGIKARIEKLTKAGYIESKAVDNLTTLMRAYIMTVDEEYKKIVEDSVNLYELKHWNDRVTKK